MDKKLEISLLVVAAGMSIYHLASCYFYILGGIDHVMLHLAFALVLIFLSTANDEKVVPKRRGWLLLGGISLGVMGYLYFNTERILWNIGFPLPLDVIMGCAMLAIVLWACKISFGIALPIVCILFLLYGFFADHFGGPILTLKEVVSTACLTFGGYDMFGKLLGLSANVIFLFIVYSGFLSALKGTDFFLQVGRIIGRYTRSGPAMTAVISSALMGTVTGQATPNIAVTGAFTIPLMKKVGYKPAIAASIEAAASGGGQITPPIMGAGAFVMADLLNVPYSKIVVWALVPSFLYFFSIAIFVHLQAIRLGIMPVKEEVDVRRLSASAGLFIIPLAAILVLLFIDYPPMFAAFWGLICLIGISFLRKDTRPSLRQIATGVVQGAVTGAKIAVATATLGPIVALMTKTGLGMGIGASVEAWSGGSVLLGLLTLAAAVIVLGMEVPTVAAYLIGAIAAVPALIRLGLDPVQAHMFTFYFASLSGLTPPIGMAAVVASKIAHASYMQTAFYSVVASAAAFLLPFVFAYNGTLLLLPGSGVFSVLFWIVVVAVAFLLFQIGFVGYFLTRLTLPERVLALAGAAGLLVFAAMKTISACAAGGILLLLTMVIQLLKSGTLSACTGPKVREISPKN